MNLLLDTHAVIWAINGSEKLPDKLKQLLEDSENICFVSIASLWEIAIKYSLGRLEFRTDLKSVFEIIEEDFEILPINSEHILYLASLTFHHRDPFDRIIISQAKEEELSLISKDMWFNNYDIDVIWE